MNVAVPSGMWQKMTDIICDDKDREYLRKIRKEYKNLVRNIWNPFDRNHEKILGCTTVNRLYITPHWRCVGLSICSYKDRKYIRKFT